MLRDRSLLESAIGRSRNLYSYADIFDIITLAVELMVGIARNHAFLQGNKRTGFIAAMQFIETNGYICKVDDTSEAFGRLFTSVVERQVPDALLQDVMRAGTEPCT